MKYALSHLQLTDKWLVTAACATNKAHPNAVRNCTTKYTETVQESSTARFRGLALLIRQSSRYLTSNFCCIFIRFVLLHFTHICHWQKKGQKCKNNYKKNCNGATTGVFVYVMIFDGAAEVRRRWETRWRIRGCRVCCHLPAQLNLWQLISFVQEVDTPPYTTRCRIVERDGFVRSSGFFEGSGRNQTAHQQPRYVLKISTPPWRLRGDRERTWQNAFQSPLSRSEMSYFSYQKCYLHFSNSRGCPLFPGS